MLHLDSQTLTLLLQLVFRICLDYIITFENHFIMEFHLVIMNFEIIITKWNSIIK